MAAPLTSERRVARREAWSRVEPLTDAERAACRSVLPGHRRRRDATDMRTIVTAVRHRWATGCSWRMLPADLPPWPTVCTFARNWTFDGTYRRLRTILFDGQPVKAA